MSRIFEPNTGHVIWIPVEHSKPYDEQQYQEDMKQSTTIDDLLPAPKIKKKIDVPDILMGLMLGVVFGILLFVLGQMIYLSHYNKTTEQVENFIKSK